MRIVSVILNYNSSEDTIRLASRFLENVNNSSVIIVDNNSDSAHIRQLLNYSKSIDDIVLIRSKENGGYARGNNMAFDYLDSISYEGYVVVLNPDIEILDWSFFIAAAAICNKDETIALMAPLMHHNGKVAKNALKMLPALIDDVLAPLPFLNKIRISALTIKPVDNDRIEVEMLPGSFLFGKFSTWKRLGFFNKNTFLFGEERILGKKISDLGLSNLVLTSYRYNHIDSKSLNLYYDSVRKFDLHLKGRLVYLKEYSHYTWIYTLFKVYYKAAINVRKIFI